MVGNAEQGQLLHTNGFEHFTQHAKQPMSISINMGKADRVSRFTVGLSLIYIGFINTALVSSQLLGTALGIFGIVNLISAIIGICPAYVVTSISTVRGHIDNTDTQSAESLSINDSIAQPLDFTGTRRKLLVSILLPMLTLLVLIGWNVFQQQHEAALSDVSQKQNAATQIAVQLLRENDAQLSSKELSESLSGEQRIIRKLLVDTDLFFLHDSQLSHIKTTIEQGMRNAAILSAVRDKLADIELNKMNQHRGMLNLEGEYYIWSTTATEFDDRWFTAVWLNPEEHQMSTHLLSPQFILMVLAAIWMTVWSSTFIVRKFSNNMKANAKSLYFRSLHDPLTGLPNRLKIDSVITEHAKKLNANNECIALLMIDLIGFRDINDTLGHDISDELISRVAKLLRELEDTNVTALRMGGDVFCLVCKTSQDRIQASRLANLIHDKLEHCHDLNGVPIAIQVRIGISSYPIDCGDMKDLARLADIALSQAKKLRVKDCFYQQEHDTHSVRKLTLLSRLRTAIEQDELTLVYQPKVNILDNTIAGVEVLVRWTDSEYGAVSPIEFVTWAEKSGLINNLTRWVLINAEKQCAQWREQGHIIPFAVNLSPANLHDSTLIPLVTELVEKGSFGNGSLELELTENAVMEDPDKALATMQILKNMGVSFSIDDFGTGLSSFTYLRKFPVSNLKIDRAFVMDSDDSDRDAVLLKSMVKLGHSLGCVVTAEGVEDQESLDRLRGFQCNHVQGYHVCKPITAEQLIDWLSNCGWNTERKVA